MSTANQSKIKYQVNRPTPGGYAFWTVSRPQLEGGPSFSEITISEKIHGAKALAVMCCRELNKPRRKR